MLTIKTYVDIDVFSLAWNPILLLDTLDSVFLNYSQFNFKNKHDHTYILVIIVMTLFVICFYLLTIQV